MSELSQTIAAGCAAEIRQRGGKASVIAKPDGGHKVVFDSPLSRSEVWAITAFVAGKHGGSFPVLEGISP